MKEWEKVFRVGLRTRQLEQDHSMGRQGDWINSWTVFSLEHGEPVTKRFYSREEDAKRGAAQIYNAIERKLLG
jgi:hypothetical protein